MAPWNGPKKLKLQTTVYGRTKKNKLFALQHYILAFEVKLQESNTLRLISYCDSDIFVYAFAPAVDFIGFLDTKDG